MRPNFGAVSASLLRRNAMILSLTSALVYGTAPFYRAAAQSSTSPQTTVSPSGVASPAVPTSVFPNGAPNSNGNGFPGATTGTGISNAQGFNAKPGVPVVPVPAGLLTLGGGVSVQLNYISESAGNPVGGIRQGTAYADQFFLGVDADLSKSIGLQGGTIHFIGTYRDGSSLSASTIGNSLAVQEIYDGSENGRLTIFSYEQKLLNDHLDIEVGRLPAQGAFLTSPLYCNFQNVGICGSPEIVFNDTNFTFFPTSTWGGHAKYFFNDEVFFHAGAFEVQPSTILANDHGFNFGLDGATGVFIPLEFGYSTTAANDPLPRNYGIGAIIDRSTYPDAAVDASGNPVVLSGRAPQQQFGRTLLYGRFDQTVWRPDLDGTRALQIFGVAAGGVSGRQTQSFQLILGGVLTAPFKSRPFDTLDLAVTEQHYSSIGLTGVRAARASLGLSSANVSPDEILVELNYGIQVTPAIRLTPNVQYIRNPDNINEPFRAKPISDVFAIGAKLSIDFLTLAHLAKGPGSP